MPKPSSRVRPAIAQGTKTPWMTKRTVITIQKAENFLDKMLNSGKASHRFRLPPEIPLLRGQFLKFRESGPPRLRHPPRNKSATKQTNTPADGLYQENNNFEIILSYFLSVSGGKLDKITTVMLVNL